ncbi:hypothetical protein IB024_01360 [Brucella sp. 6810]|uniref:hypothetical protein n=1 Tax=Brucella sp. 6810 TaxID=2769351 RepID=UPI00165AE454|nr:hypothetical protein [Brucella sp. 6810]QNQ62437.1 hypothetical protein IB024_01360 [Brucella sp. 6810]
MTQTFIGYKPGIGPVLKCLKYDADDPLTLPNTAYERYLYNSENHKLSYAATTLPFSCDWGSVNALPSDFDLYDGVVGPVISGARGSGTTLKDCTFVYRPSYILPDGYYPPIIELREKSFNTGRIIATISNSENYPVAGTRSIINYQYKYQMMRVSSYDTSITTQTLPATYNGRLWNRLSRIPIGEWIAIAQPPYVYSDNRSSTQVFSYLWDLPADSTPLRSYNYVPDLFAMHISSERFALSRPGFDVNSPVSYSQIINSDKAPNLCIMSGTIQGLANGQSVTITPPPGIALSETAVLDFMVKRSGDPWYVPGIIHVDESDFETKRLEYQVVGNSMVLYNINAETLDFRYAVFNVDRNGTSAGGTEVMFRGNDGTRDFFQIKKPGTSDPATKPNDILFDSRFPNMQIIDDGFIPASEFYNSTPSESMRFGTKKYTKSFSNGGFLPFLKFMIVFPNCITTPYHETFRTTGLTPSNTSCIARLDDDNSVTFFISPGNPSFNISGEIKGGAPDPIGIRYYIFGIAPN